MKKYLLFPLIIAIFLMGCSQNEEANTPEGQEALSQGEVFAKFVEEEDLASYILKTTHELSLHAESEEKRDTSRSYGTLEVIKEPRTSHSLW